MKSFIKDVAFGLIAILFVIVLSICHPKPWLAQARKEWDATWRKP